GAHLEARRQATGGVALTWLRLVRLDQLEIAPGDAPAAVRLALGWHDAFVDPAPDGHPGDPRGLGSLVPREPAARGGGLGTAWLRRLVHGSLRSVAGR